VNLMQNNKILTRATKRLHKINRQDVNVELWIDHVDAFVVALAQFALNERKVQQLIAISTSRR